MQWVAWLSRLIPSRASKPLQPPGVRRSMVRVLFQSLPGHRSFCNLMGRGWVFPCILVSIPSRASKLLQLTPTFANSTDILLFQSLPGHRSFCNVRRTHRSLLRAPVSIPSRASKLLQRGSAESSNGGGRVSIPSRASKLLQQPSSKALHPMASNLDVRASP